jgi:hypothetical protein
VTGRGRGVSRARHKQISREARDIYSLARTKGLTVDLIQDQLLRSFPGELAAGEARMYAMGWTVPIVREGLLALAAEDGHDPPGLEAIDVSRWLRGEHRPRAWLQTLCRLFQCHQARLGWPPQGNELPIDFTYILDEAAHSLGSQRIGPSRGVFMQYLNPEILELYGVRIHFDAHRVARIALLLSRYALLVSEGILVMPASYLFEVPLIHDLIRHLAPLREAGLLGFTSPSVACQKLGTTWRQFLPETWDRVTGWLARN